MASFTEPPPPGIVGGIGEHWLQRQQTFLRDVAKLDQPQTWTGQNTFARGKVVDGPITLTSNYRTLLDVQVASHNATDQRSGGGNAAIYVQHAVDDSVATVNGVNCGIRVQTQTLQQSTAAVNDVVSGYFGLYNGGVNCGGFGAHTDAYHAGSGANLSTYGMSAEMYRSSSTGFTAAFHARTIGRSDYFDNDYAFLASPGGDGSKKFKSIFAGGAFETGTVPCDFGLDLRAADCAIAGVYMNDDVPIEWGNNVRTHTRSWTGSGRGAMDCRFNGSLLFAIEDSGRVAFSDGQFDTMSAGANGLFLVIASTSGSVYKIPLHDF